MDLMIKGAALVVCGAGIGWISAWLIATRPKKTLPEREIRRRAKKLYDDLMTRYGGA